MVVKLHGTGASQEEHEEEWEESQQSVLHFLLDL
jgi:hypothetical protein